jgi:EAL domain-containing protein (putative c-di-GMP-specific phosphodiesterase class I)
LPNSSATADNFGLLFGDFAQGYFYSPPQPAELMLAWLQSWHHG